jgi:hypothetical protein
VRCLEAGSRGQLGAGWRSGQKVSLVAIRPHRDHGQVREPRHSRVCRRQYVSHFFTTCTSRSLVRRSTSTCIPTANAVVVGYLHYRRHTDRIASNLVARHCSCKQTLIHFTFYIYITTSKLHTYRVHSSINFLSI